MAEVRITQYLRPNGKTCELKADIDEEHAQKAKDLVISTECISPTEIVIYGRRRGQSVEEELTEIATNGPGENSPNKALCRLIDRF